MGIKKKKQKRRTMTYYKMVFHFKPPFNIIVDPEFVKHVFQKKMDLEERLNDLLGFKIYMFTTPCVLKYLRDQGEEYRTVLNKFKNFQVIQCRHSEPISPNECIVHVVNERKQKNKLKT